MSVCASLSGVNINQELLRSRTALKVPLGTILPWLRDLGSVTLERQTERLKRGLLIRWLVKEGLTDGRFPGECSNPELDSQTSFLHF